MIEGIAAASMCMSAAKVQQAVSVSLLKDVMQQQEASAQNLIQTLSWHVLAKASEWKCRLMMVIVRRKFSNKKV